MAAPAVAEGGNSAAPEGCSWRVGETGMPGGEEVLLFRGLQCGDAVTSLEVAGGARSAEVTFASAGWAGPERAGTVFATVISADAAEPTANLLAWTRAAMEGGDPNRCTVRRAGEGYPTDAYVVDTVTLEEAAAATEQREAECGPFGFAPDAGDYWRVFGGYAWHFAMGQDIADVDPASMKLVPRAGAAPP